MSDALVENPESFQIKLLEDNPAAGPARYLLDDGYYESTVGDTVSVTLIDGEPFVYMEEYYEEELYEGDSRTVYVYLSRAADVSVTLPIVVDPTSTATVGSDFTVPANVTIPAGQTSGSFTVTTLSDAVVEEPSESIKLNLGDFSSYPIWDVNAWYNAYSAYPMADIPAYTSTSMELTIQDYSIEEPSPAP